MIKIHSSYVLKLCWIAITWISFYFTCKLCYHVFSMLRFWMSWTKGLHIQEDIILPTRIFLVSYPYRHRMNLWMWDVVPIYVLLYIQPVLPRCCFCQVLFEVKFLLSCIYFVGHCKILSLPYYKFHSYSWILTRVYWWNL